MIPFVDSLNDRIQIFKINLFKSLCFCEGNFPDDFDIGLSLLNIGQDRGDGEHYLFSFFSVFAEFIEFG